MNIRLREPSTRIRLKDMLAVILVVGCIVPLPVVGQPPVQTEIQKLLPSEGGDFFNFGHAAAVQGDLAMVSSSTLDQSVYVFERQDGVWLQTAKLQADITGQDFGDSVAVSEATLLVGVPGDDVWASASGSAYVFNEDGGGWTLTVRLVADEGAQGDNLGDAVAIDDDLALLGAPGFNYGRGAAYMFEREDGSWAQNAKLVASEGNLSDKFGAAVALSDDYALIGAPQDYGVAELSGSAYVFERQADDTWLQVAKLLASDGGLGDRFGSAVALSESYALIGAPIDLGGSAYLFEREPDGSWSEIAKLRASDAAGVMYFGDTLSIDGQLAVIGARNDATYGNASGAAYVFERRPDDGTWIETAKLLASDGAEGDLLGYSVAVSGDVALAGARGDDDLGEQSGAAYVFAVAQTPEECSLLVSPLTLDFGTVEIGMDLTLGTTLTNEGTAICDVSAMVDSQSDEFVLTSESEFSVAAGDSAEVLVNYAPVDLIDDAGTLALIIADPTDQFEIPLYGTAATVPVDIDIIRFRVSKVVHLRNIRPISINLTVTNAGYVEGDASATVTGEREGIEVYRETMVVTDALGNGPQTFTFDTYVPEAVEGEIQWTVTVEDGDADEDRETAVTSVR